MRGINGFIKSKQIGKYMQLFKSLKWKFIVSLIVLTFIVIIANRLIAQSIVSSKITDRVITQIEVTLTECGSSTLGNQEFQKCSNESNKGNLLKFTSDFFTYCDQRNIELPHEKCKLFEGKGVKWKNSNSTLNAFETANINYAGDVWHAVRPVNDSSARKVIYQDSISKEAMWQIWNIRDETTLRTLPLIFLCQLLIGIFLFRMIKVPVKQIERSLSRVNENTLSSSIPKEFIYNEFTEISVHIDSMRKSLAASFNKAKRFSGDVAHQLKTPLTILRGNAEELERLVAHDSVQHDQIQNIADEIERLITITDKLLLLSKADANTLKPMLKDICLSDLINYWINDVSTFSERLKITSNIQPNIHWACDVALIRMLIGNLYENSVKYNTKNGWIDFQLTQTDGVIRFSTENPSLRITEGLEQLAFERFYRSGLTDSTQIEGTGLGLSICYEIAKIHNASLALNVTESGTVMITLTM